MDQTALYSINRPESYFRAVALGATVHRANMERLFPGSVPRPCSSCTQGDWEVFWSTVIMAYNPNKKNVYKTDADRRNGVVRRGRFYEPF